MNVSVEEADAALERKARRLEDEGGSEYLIARAVMFHCGYDEQPNGMYRIADEAPLGWQDVIQCLDVIIPQTGTGSLSNCLKAVAMTKFVSRILGAGESVPAMQQLLQDVECVEFSREVDIEAERHGLERTGKDSWVPAILWGLINVVDAAMAPATAPAIFLLKPGNGAPEQACYDAPEPPAAKCTDTSGCPPKGAEPPDQGGVDVSSGTLPGGAGSSGGDL